MPPSSVPPRADARPTTIEAHGTTRVDEFAWLRAENWQDVIRDPACLPADIRSHLEAENAYTAAVMRDTEALQAQLFAEMKGRIAEDDATVPAPDGPWEYFSAFRPGGQYRRFIRRRRAGTPADDQVYFDGDLEA